MTENLYACFYASRALLKRVGVAESHAQPSLRTKTDSEIRQHDTADTVSFVPQDFADQFVLCCVVGSEKGWMDD